MITTLVALLVAVLWMGADQVMPRVGEAFSDGGALGGWPVSVDERQLAPPLARQRLPDGRWVDPRNNAGRADRPHGPRHSTTGAAWQPRGRPSEDQASRRHGLPPQSGESIPIRPVEADDGANAHAASGGASNGDASNDDSRAALDPDLLARRDERAKPSGAMGDAAHLPGRAQPRSAPRPGVYQVAWEFDSTITIAAGGTGAGDGDPRRPATVTTHDLDGNLLVSYPATAFVDDLGNLHVDAQGSAISGPWAGNWSPDSFAVDEYGQVHSLDDNGQARNGWTR